MDLEEDDFVCPATLARPEAIVGEQPGALLLVTRSGSHVAFNEGWSGSGSFHLRVSLDFLDAARRTAPTPHAAQHSDGHEVRGLVEPRPRAAA